MMILCSRHGYGSAVQMSPDLSEILEQAYLPPHQELLYEYDGEPYIRMLVSERFAADRGIEKFGCLELPDDYPEWHKDMVAVCEKCVAASHNA